jgi:5-methylcytosine-specific restriction endonuclease McrA
MEWFFLLTILALMFFGIRRGRNSRVGTSRVLGYPTLKSESHTEPARRRSILRPEVQQRTEEEIESDRKAYLAQELFFSQIRWQSHLSQAEAERLKRLPIQGLNDHKIHEMLREQNYTCFYCVSAIHFANHHKDHLVPLAMWGPNHIANIVLSCPECNLSKGSKDPFHFIKTTTLQLRHADELTHLVRVKIDIIRQLVPSWASNLL